MFDSGLGFSEMSERTELLPVAPDPGWRPAAIFEISNDEISETSHPINFVFDSRCLLSAVSEPNWLSASTVLIFISGNDIPMSECQSQQTKMIVQLSWVGFNVKPNTLQSLQRQSSQPISWLVQNTQPSQPITWLTLTKQKILTTKNNAKT